MTMRSQVIDAVRAVSAPGPDAGGAGKKNYTEEPVGEPPQSAT
jgi:hypothetical protein